ncbi:MAG: hypothetical protein AB7F40_01165 [Victivallaceae bacterium]|nr:hypothetical protein [Victivallaceae bacterium]
MAEDLQGLLEKIQKQGLDKANAAHDEIIGKAKSEAEAVIAAATKEAEEIRRAAKAESESLTKRAEEAVRQAARDIIMKLEGELKSRLVAVVQENTVAAMTPELMASIISEMVKSYLANGGKVTALELLLSPKTLRDAAPALQTSLRQSFGIEPRLFPDMEIRGGVKVAINGSDVFYDFSDQAITDIVAAYIGPRLAAVVRGKAE